MNRMNSETIPEPAELLITPPVVSGSGIEMKPLQPLSSTPDENRIFITYDEGFEPQPGVPGNPGHRRYRNSKGQFVPKEVIDRIEATLTSNSPNNLDNNQEETEELAGVDELKEVRVEAVKNLVKLNEIKKERELTTEEEFDYIINAKMVINLQDQISEMNGRSVEQRKEIQKNAVAILTQNGLRLDVNNEKDVKLLDDAFEAVYRILETNDSLSEEQRRELEEYIINLNSSINNLDPKINIADAEADENNLRERLAQLRIKPAEPVAEPIDEPNFEIVDLDNENLTEDEKAVRSFLVANFGNVEEAADSISQQEFDEINSHIEEIERLNIFTEQSMIQKMLKEGSSILEVNAGIMTMRQREAKSLLNNIYEARQKLLISQGNESELEQLANQIVMLSEAVSNSLLEETQYYEDGLIRPSGNTAYNQIIEYKSQTRPAVNRAALATIPLPDVIQPKSSKSEKAKNYIAGSLAGLAVVATLGVLLSGDSDSGSEISTANTTVEENNDSEDQAQNNEEAIESAVDAAVAEVTADFEEQLNSLEEEVDTLQDEVSELEKQLAELDSEVEDTTEDTNVDEEETAGSETPETPESAESLEAYKNISVPNGAGFQQSLINQYGLSDTDSWRAYKVIEPYVNGAPGTYLGPQGDVRISSPGQFKLPEAAAQALQQFIDSLNETENDDE